MSRVPLLGLTYGDELSRDREPNVKCATQVVEAAVSGLRGDEDRKAPRSLASPLTPLLS